jgi:opacity protein-like surface antigen
MKNLFIALLLPFALIGSACADEEWNGNVNLFLGAKALDDTEWLANEQSESGILIDFGHDRWPLHIVIDMLRSNGDFEGLVYFPFSGTSYAEEEVITSELNLGVRHYFDVTPVMRPYIGGGLSLVKLEADWNIGPGLLIHDEGRGSGIWLNGGILWNLDAFNIGFDIRASVAEVDMDIGYYEGGGGHAGIILGYHW